MTTYNSFPLILSFVLATLVFAVRVEAGHQNQGYFQYANVPAYGQYEFGYHRGNPSHYTSRYEQAKDWRFRTKVRWGDKSGGYGEHYWDYNHIDQGKDAHGHGHKGEEYSGHYEQQHNHGGGGHGWQGGYSEPATVIAPASSSAPPLSPPLIRYDERYMPNNNRRMYRVPMRYTPRYYRY